jgi:hypothetical protein
MNSQTNNNFDNITFKEFVKAIKSWFDYLKSYWVKFLFIGFIGGCIGFFYASNQPITFTSKLTFVVEEGKGAGSSLGGLASLAGQFGVDVGSSSGGGILTGDNLLLYFKSPSLAREVLLSKYDSKSNKSIADEYAKVHGLKKLWEQNKKIGKVEFKVLNKSIVYTRLQDSLLQEIINNINAKQFQVSKTDKKAGFIDVVSTMQSELLAKIYCERIVQKVVERYISIKTQRQNATVNKLQSRVDSLAFLLKQKTLSGASLQNTSSIMDINPIYKTGTNVAVETTLRDKTLLATIFASVTQNLELAKFTLSQETPVIQIIDSPILPLKKNKLSRLKTAILGSILISFLFLFGLIIRRVYSDLMKN